MKKIYFLLTVLTCLNYGYGQQPLIFNNGVWTPSAPNLGTGENDVIIQSGTYTISTTVDTKNLTIEPGGAIVITSHGALQVNGHLITNDNVFIESTSERFGSLMVLRYEDPFEFEDPIPAKVTGTVTYSRHVNTVGMNDLIAAPVSGQSFTDFRIANPNLAQNNAGTKFLFGPFNKAASDYDLYTDTTTSILEPTVGYRAAIGDREEDNNLEFTGTVTVKSLQVPIINSGEEYQEWNLIGNPYTTYISASEFIRLNGGKLHLDARAIYGYNAANPFQKWVIWNNSSIDSNPNLAVAPGQGFYVATPSGSSNPITIGFTTKMMIFSNSDDFTIGRPTNEVINIGSITLNLANNVGDYYTNLYFNEKATKGMDPGYDAMSRGRKAEKDFAIYSHLVEDNKGVDLAIQSVGYDDLAGIIFPIGVNARKGEQLTISILDMNLPEGTEVYLEDNVTNTQKDLTSSDYIFTTTENISGTGRFFLHVINQTLSTPELELNGLQIYTAADKTLHVKGLIKENTELKLYDLQGRVVTATQLKANTNSNNLSLSNLGTGIYIVELKSNSFNRTQKVVLK